MRLDAVDFSWLAFLAEVLVRDVVSIQSHAFDVLPHAAAITTDHVTIIVIKIAIDGKKL